MRVLLRSSVLDRCPHLATEAVEASATLGAVWELVDATGPPPADQPTLGRSAAQWATSRVRLAPLDVHHMATSTWRRPTPSTATAGDGGDARRARMSSDRRRS